MQFSACPFASSAASESEFSTLNYVKDVNRGSLSMDHLEQLGFIRAYLEMKEREWGEKPKKKAEQMARAKAAKDALFKKREVLFEQHRAQKGPSQNLT